MLTETISESSYKVLQSSQKKDLELLTTFNVWTDVFFDLFSINLWTCSAYKLHLNI